MQEPQSVEQQLTSAAGLSELYQVTHYRGVRTDKAGHTGFVDIEIWEATGEPSTPRFQVIARDAYGRRASSNGADDLQLEIATVHWGNLDDEPHGDSEE